MWNNRTNARPGRRPYRAPNQRPSSAVASPPKPQQYQHHREPPPHPGPLTTVSGVLEMHPKGYGFLRDSAKNYTAKSDDPYVPIPLLQRFKLAEGQLITAAVEPSRPGMPGCRVANVLEIEGVPAADFQRRDFDELTAIDPSATIRLETGAEPLTTRVMDLFTPIGKGQRGLIVAPPRTGKTILLQHIAAAVAKNHPEMKLFVLLIDERPEEVTEMKRTVKGEVVASSSDRESGNHLRTAELIMNRAKRLAESGKEVFVLLDSLTRLARAYNKASNTGRTMSGGMDVKALDVPKRLFGAARAFEEGGSLTVIGTALIETGSKMDDVIFQEFKGTGNMELVLDRKLSDRRIYPAIDLSGSGTRKEERLIPAEALATITLLRRTLLQLKPVEAMEHMVKQLAKSESNAAFLQRITLNVKS